MRRKTKIRVGLIADTHGLLRPEATAFLRTADYIIHAGDIGDSAVLDELRAISRVCAVRGNNDSGPWARPLRESETLRLGAVGIHVIHDLAELRIDPAALGVQAVVSGHSHKPSLERRDGVLFLNPGSAGPRRFKLPVALGELLIDGPCVSARLVELPDGRLLAARSLSHTLIGSFNPLIWLSSPPHEQRSRGSLGREGPRLARRSSCAQGREPRSAPGRAAAHLRPQRHRQDHAAAGG